MRSSPRHATPWFPPTPTCPCIRAPRVLARSRGDDAQEETQRATGEPPSVLSPEKPRLKAESTDAVATFLTRRFGLAGGLAWLGFLAVGSLGEQVKTRMEVAGQIEVCQYVLVPAEGLRNSMCCPCAAS